MKRHWLTRGVYNRLYRAPILAQEFIQTMILLLKKKRKKKEKRNHLHYPDFNPNPPANS